MEAEHQVFEQTGEHTLYTVNVTDEIPNVYENAHRAVEPGVNAVLVNYLAVGFPVLRALVKDPSINVPILAHMDVAGALYESEWHGISSTSCWASCPAWPAPISSSTRRLKGLLEIIDRLRLPYVAYNQGPIVHLETAGTMLFDFRDPIKVARKLKPRKHVMEEMGMAYTANGIIILARCRIYTSMANTDEVIVEALIRFESVLCNMDKSIQVP